MNNEGYLLHVLEIMANFGVPFIKSASKHVLRADVFIAVQVKLSLEIVFLPNCNHKGLEVQTGRITLYCDLLDNI